jgi:threonine synthase
MTLTYENGSLNHLPYSFQPESLLGEGRTPFSKSTKICEAVNIDKLYFKHEFQHPSGSHKDRMSKYAITRAKDCRYSMVVSASSGNAAVSIALYSNHFDIDCRIYSKQKMSQSYRAAL